MNIPALSFDCGRGTDWSSLYQTTFFDIIQSLVVTLCTSRILSISFPHTVHPCPLILSLWHYIDLPEYLNHIAGSSLTTLVYNAVIGTAVLCLHFCIDQLVLEHIVANSFYLTFIGGLNRRYYVST